MPESEVIYRPYTLEDRNFIESSWGSSYYAASNLKELLSPDEFHAYHRPLRDRFFSRPTATVIIASPTIDPVLIAGWAAVEVLPNCTCLHYVYVKSQFRREFGIRKGLIERSIRGIPLYSHLTPKWGRILGKGKYQDFRFAPHLT